jgi:inward rectifier potassium channel
MTPLRAIGKQDAPWEDFYHWILYIRWSYFFLFVAGVFVAINVFFGFLYHLDTHGITGARPGSFEDAFYFSVQTMATIGYGGMSPATRYTHLLVTVEALLGIVTTALLTGITFAKFARPSARVLFSEKLVIGKRDGVPQLSMRMANFRGNNVAEAQLKFFLLRNVVTAEGERFRRPTDVPLVRSTTAVFTLSWTAYHIIDENSPFYGEGAFQRLRDEEADLFVVLSGYDETLGQTIFARYRYRLDDVVVNARFVDTIHIDEKGVRTIDYSRFHDVEPEPVPLP